MPYPGLPRAWVVAAAGRSVGGDGDWSSFHFRFLHRSIAKTASTLHALAQNSPTEESQIEREEANEAATKTVAATSAIRDSAFASATTIMFRRKLPGSLRTGISRRKLFKTPSPSLSALPTSHALFYGPVDRGNELCRHSSYVRCYQLRENWRYDGRHFYWRRFKIDPSSLPSRDLLL